MAGESSSGGVPSADDLIAVGIVRKAHGVRGEASVEPLSDTVERLTQLTSAYLVSPDRKQVKPSNIRSARLHSGRALLLFEGIDAPERVRDFHNWTLEVTEDNARELDDDEVFIHDLIGLRVLEQETELGRVEEAVEMPAGLMLVVRRPDGGTFDLPFVAALCTVVDVERGVIETDLPTGLVDLDSVPAVEETPESELETDSEAEPTADPEAAQTALTIDVVTIFPSMFDPIRSEGVLARAIKSGLIELKVWDLREHTKDRHRTTDDEAYGGGGGMVMLAEPVFACLDAISELRGDGPPRVILMSPQGRVFDQQRARELSQTGRIVILCGRYEGFDERVMSRVDDEISIGDFVVTGGELPAMLVIDAISRMIDGVVGTRNSVEKDSFYNGLLDYPHYTRPAELRGLTVPEVLISGHFEKIRQWRVEQSLRSTLRKRPDLLERAELDAEGEKILTRLRSEEASSDTHKG